MISNILVRIEALIMMSDPLEGEKRLKYTDVLANAIMLQNVVDLSQIIQQLRGEGLQFSSEDIGRLSRLCHR